MVVSQAIDGAGWHLTVYLQAEIREHNPDWRNHIRNERNSHQFFQRAMVKSYAEIHIHRFAGRWETRSALSCDYCKRSKLPCRPPVLPVKSMVRNCLISKYKWQTVTEGKQYLGKSLIIIDLYDKRKNIWILVSRNINGDLHNAVCPVRRRQKTGKVPLLFIQKHRVLQVGREQTISGQRDRDGRPITIFISQPPSDNFRLFLSYCEIEGRWLLFLEPSIVWPKVNWIFLANQLNQSARSCKLLPEAGPAANGYWKQTSRHFLSMVRVIASPWVYTDLEQDFKPDSFGLLYMITSSSFEDLETLQRANQYKVPCLIKYCLSVVIIDLGWSAMFLLSLYHIHQFKITYLTGLTKCIE